MQRASVSGVRSGHNKPEHELGRAVVLGYFVKVLPPLPALCLHVHVIHTIPSWCKLLAQSWDRVSLMQSRKWYAYSGFQDCIMQSWTGTIAKHIQTIFSDPTTCLLFGEHHLTGTPDVRQFRLLWTIPSQENVFLLLGSLLNIPSWWQLKHKLSHICLLLLRYTLCIFEWL